ncbi:hypothetical protein [Oceanobacillus neutriphilus]|uniref:ABC transporter permease n=1 Tax=Oceanobacillus neutriphilus TaxID=531815 RepID=A0ABQ2NUD3_9BACI|nr:hypothetical protein [Oceanobacillus neutriphilus]GGP10773.1 hypothetical protein GCM10011346_20230 [Oceanobacillus neutriphilus]
MSGMFFRCRLFFKKWVSSIYGIALLAAIPIAAIILYHDFYYEETGKLLSLIFEQLAPIWLILILQRYFSIEFDSGFFTQVVTYPIARYKFLLERFLFACMLFFIMLGIIALVLTSIFGAIIWKAFLYTLPLYFFYSAVMLIGLVISKRSLGALLGGIFLFLLSFIGAPLLGQALQMIMLKYGSVIYFLEGKTGYAFADNDLYYYNRLMYMGFGIILFILALIKFQRKPV